MQGPLTSFILRLTFSQIFQNQQYFTNFWHSDRDLVQYISILDLVQKIVFCVGSVVTITEGKTFTPHALFFLSLAEQHLLLPTYLGIYESCFRFSFLFFHLTFLFFVFIVSSWLKVAAYSFWTARELISKISRWRELGISTLKSRAESRSKIPTNMASKFLKFV